MSYQGDYLEDYATLNFKFTTRGLTGIPTTLAGGPVVKVYKANATDSETATGVTLTADFDGVTGLNNVLIDLSASALYTPLTDYAVVITTGTVGGVSVVGETVGTFSIENRVANVVRISSDKVAADNLEAFLDGTGGIILKADQLKLSCDVAGEGAFDCVNVNAAGCGQKNDGGARGMHNVGDIAQHNIGESIGIYNEGGSYGQYDSGGVADIVLGTSGGIHQIDGTNILAEITAKLDALAVLGAGDGDTIVNHDTGGVDNLRAEVAGVGVDGLSIRAYLKLLYDLGVFVVCGNSTTGSDGRWVRPMMLDADTYTIVFSGPGYKTSTKEVDVT